MKRLEGKVAIITGCASGQGKAEAIVFAREGAKVVITDINFEELSKVADEINQSGGQAVAVKQDVSSEEGWKEVVALALDKFGKINVLVNNAGTFSPKGVLDENIETYNKILAINLTSQFLGMKYVGKAMAEAGNGGSIVNCASIAAIRGWGSFIAYSASKGGVAGQSRSAVVDFAPYNIRVNWIHPGTIVTGMSQPVIDMIGDQLKAAIPLKKFGMPEDIAYAALYFASDESGFVTGAELSVDGGRAAV